MLTPVGVYLFQMQGLTCRPVLKGQQYTNAAVGMWKLLGGTLDGAVVDAIDDVMGRHAVNGAADRLGRTQHLLHHTREVPATSNTVLFQSIQLLRSVTDRSVFASYGSGLKLYYGSSCNLLSLPFLNC